MQPAVHASARLESATSSLSGLLDRIERSSYRERLAREFSDAHGAFSSSIALPLSASALPATRAPYSNVPRDAAVRGAARASVAVVVRNTVAGSRSARVASDESFVVEDVEEDYSHAAAPQQAHRSARAAPRDDAAAFAEEEEEEEEDDDEDDFDAGAEMPARPTASRAAFDRRRASVACLSMIDQVWSRLDPSGKGSVSKRELLSTLRSDPMVAQFLQLPQHFHESSAQGSGNIAQALEAFRSMSAETGKITFVELQAFVKDLGEEEGSRSGSGSSSVPSMGRSTTPPPPPTPPAAARGRTTSAATGAERGGRAASVAELRSLLRAESVDGLLRHVLVATGQSAVSLREHDVELSRADFCDALASRLRGGSSGGSAAARDALLDATFTAFDWDGSERVSLSLVVVGLRAACVPAAGVAAYTAAVFNLFANNVDFGISRPDFLHIVRRAPAEPFCGEWRCGVPSAPAPMLTPPVAPPPLLRTIARFSHAH